MSGFGLTGRLDRRLATTWDGRLTRPAQRDLRTALLWQGGIALAAGVLVVLLALGALAGWPEWLGPLLGLLFVAAFVPTAMTCRARALDSARSDVERTLGLPAGAVGGLEFSGGTAAFDAAVARARDRRPDDPALPAGTGRRSQARRRMLLESEGRLTAAAVDALVARVRWGLVVIAVLATTVGLVSVLPPTAAATAGVLGSAVVVLGVARFRAATRRAQDEVARHLGLPPSAARSLVVHRTTAELDAGVDRARRVPT